MRSLTYAALVAAAFFWGGSAIAGKLLLDSLLPASVTFSRFAVAAVALLAVCLAMRLRLRVTLREHGQFAILGVVGVTLCYYFYFEGLARSTAINAALAEATIPLVTLGLSVLARRERSNRWQTAGFVVSYLGVVLIITRMDWRVVAESRYNVGDLLLIASTLCFGLYNFLLRWFAPRATSMVQTYYIFAYGSLALLPWLLLSDGAVRDLGRLPGLPADLLFAAVFMCVGSSVLAYVFFNHGIEQIGASKASSFINLVPVITIVAAIALLRETPSAAQIVGGLVVLVGVYLANRAKQTDPPIEAVPAAEPVPSVEPVPPAAEAAIAAPADARESR
ncbi:DMT family transporter [Solwaraspora sp. WMMD406]|uniref:DMT family transporter n=1 Tax=Solwaraspora sp. WMMD406 TaxID=3016095 RepID=UPI002415FAA7|nr:DMT family transporter [Solwaraspora sp. WMMD406]MDG4762678.1 DMT family transporter [Solwaraspora sp. WMMD406]